MRRPRCANQAQAIGSWRKCTYSVAGPFMCTIGLCLANCEAKKPMDALQLAALQTPRQLRSAPHGEPGFRARFPRAAGMAWDRFVGSSATVGKSGSQDRRSDGGIRGPGCAGYAQRAHLLDKRRNGPAKNQSLTTPAFNLSFCSRSSWSMIRDTGRQSLASSILATIVTQWRGVEACAPECCVVDRYQLRGSGGAEGAPQPDASASRRRRLAR